MPTWAWIGAAIGVLFLGQLGYAVWESRNVEPITVPRGEWLCWVGCLVTVTLLGARYMGYR